MEPSKDVLGTWRRPRESLMQPNSPRSINVRTHCTLRRSVSEPCPTVTISSIIASAVCSPPSPRP
jgi:hypothetical protein